MSKRQVLDIAFSTALRAVKARHGNVFHPSTVERFAWQRFQAASVGRTEEECVLPEWGEFAEFVLMDEAVKFELAKRQSKATRMRAKR